MRLVVGIFFLANSFQLNAQPVKEHGALHADGVQLKDEHNNAVVLRGMSFGWSCFHPRFYTAGAVHTLVQDWHCTVIRAALGVEPAKGYRRGFRNTNSINKKCN